MIPRLPKGFTHPMVIGEGAFSSVYRARQQALDRWIAIKILPEKNPANRQTLLKEAQVQAQLNVASIPAVYDAFEWGPQVCIVMQWIKGISLQALLEKNISPEHRKLLAAALVESLAGLHRMGYAHRDLKPANILISPRDGLFLVDFGFSKNITDGEKSLAMTVKGTPAFMAPELWQTTQAVDFLKADLYALGKILRLIQPGENWEPLIRLCLEEKHEKRPPSAGALWSAWQTLWAPDSRRDWKSLAESQSSEKLSENLLLAAKNLMLAEKHEEAYWLLSECLEENPDSAEAMRIMDQFPVLSQKRNIRQKVGLGILAFSFVLTLVTAFYFGKQSERHRSSFGLTRESTNTALFLPPSHSISKFKTQGYLKVFPKNSPQLSAWLFLKNTDACATLLLDGKVVPPTEMENGLTLAFGEHSLVCQDTSAGRIRKEKFRVLPFQKKVMGLNPLSAPIEKS